MIFVLRKQRHEIRKKDTHICKERGVQQQLLRKKRPLFFVGLTNRRIIIDPFTSEIEIQKVCTFLSALFFQNYCKSFFSNINRFFEPCSISYFFSRRYNKL